MFLAAKASTFARTASTRLLLGKSCNSDVDLSSIITTSGCTNEQRSLARHFHVSVPRSASQFKARDRKELLKSVHKPDDGTEGENYVSLDANIKSREDMFTDERTPELLFNGVPFNQIPVCSIKVTKNNTMVHLADHENKVICFRTAGAEGFKKCRKGTNVAGQSTALHVSMKAVAMGITDIRLKIRGLGPGRMAAIKGIQMGGLNVISVTDDTRVALHPTLRPRKVRRL